MGIVTGTELTFQGSPIGGPMPVTATVALQSEGFVVAWVDDEYDIQLKKFDSDGDREDLIEIDMDPAAYAGFFAPTVALLSTGEIAVTWTAASGPVGNTRSDVFLQLVDSNFNLVGTAPTLVNFNMEPQAFPQITALGTAGQFAITWFGETSSVDPFYDVFAQIWGMTSDIVVNTTNTTGDQDFAQITRLASGFVVSWFDEPNDDIYIDIFADDGTSIAEVRVNDDDVGGAGIIGTANLSGGKFVTAWSGITANDGTGMAFRIFDSVGNASAVFEANTETDGTQTLSSVTALANGNFVLAWGTCGCSGATPTSSFAIFKDDGSALQAEVALDTGMAALPTLEALSDGSFIVAWANVIDQSLAIRVFNADGSLRYTDDVDVDANIILVNGAALEIAVLANGGFVVSSTVQSGYYSHVFDITRDGPTSSNSTVALLEGASHTFSLADFPFSDAEQDELTDIQMTSLPSNGTLMLNGVVVTVGQTILPTDIIAGKLVWTPSAGASGNGLASLSYKLVDDGAAAIDDSATSSAYSIRFNVTRINDAPSATNVTRTALEDTGYVFSATSFAFSDGDGDVLKAVTITALPAKGNLTIDGRAVTAGQSISTDDIAAGKFVWTPPAETSGTNVASLSFKVQDTGGTANGGIDTSGVYSLTFNVTAVNDAPVLDYQGPSTTLENVRLTMDVLAGASDVDGGALTVTNATIVSGFGKITVGNDGTLLYDPTKAPNQDIAEGESRAVTISYTVSDGQGGTMSAEIDITVEGISPDIFRGTPDRDRLIGTHGADRIFGLAGRDRLDGGSGDDVLKGGRDADTFVFGRDYGRDIIADFKATKGDAVDLSDAAGIGKFADLMKNHIEDAGRNLVIHADDGSALVLRGVDIDDVSRENFIL